MSTEPLFEPTAFRKDAAFLATLEGNVLRSLFADPARTSVRAWVPNAGSGEDVYWTAILLADYVQAHGLSADLRVFGSDSDAQALQRARGGLFPRSVERALPREHLQRYFHAQLSGYKVVKRIRDCALFSCHELLVDPPFSKLDLVMGERAFAELAPEQAGDVIQILHYALQPGGYLLLGPRDVPRGISEYFTPVADDSGIFKSREDVRVKLPPGLRAPRRPAVMEQAQSRLGEESALCELSERLLLDEYAPACIVVDIDDAIVHTRGNAARFLRSAEGTASNKLTDRVRPELRSLISALAKAQRQDGASHSVEVDLELDGSRSHLELSARPLERANAQCIGRAFVIVETPPRERLMLPAPEIGSELQTMEMMQRQLTLLKGEFRASSAELRESNEELQSLNEELESANVELSLTQEQLQSLNEELATTNEQLRGSIFDMERANSDLRNLFENTRVATVFLDRNQHVRSFTQSARELFNLIDSDPGRPLADVTARFDYEGLYADAEQVMRTRTFKETQVRSSSNHWYVLRILPYWVSDVQIDGVVITFSDVTQLKQAELEVARLTARLSTQLRWLRSLVDVVPVGIGFASKLDPDVRINRSAAELLGVEGEELDSAGPLGLCWATLENDSPSQRLVHDAMTAEHANAGVELEVVDPNGEPRHLLLRSTPLRDDLGDRWGTVSGLFDVTETRRDLDRAELGARQQTILAELGLFALETQDIDELLARALPAVCKGTGAELADFALASVDGHWLNPLASAGFMLAPAEEEVYPGSLAGRVIAQGEPLTFSSELDAPPDWPEQLRRESVRAGARVAVGGDPEPGVHGVLSVYRREACAFSAQELAFLASAAHVLAFALQRRQLERDQQRQSNIEALRGVELQVAQNERLASLGAFASGIAHELNNPLNNIALNAAYSASTHDEERRGKALETIRNNALRCGRIVDSVLRLARDEATEKWESRLNPILRQAVDFVRSQAFARELEVAFELEEPGVWVRCNPTELEQVFVNLLKNAAQARPEGCSVSIRAEALDGSVRVTVADDGPGISEPESQRIFEPFYSSRRGDGGTGLGLSLVERTLTTHGGSIRVLPGQGEGATFEIEIPTVAASKPAQQEQHDQSARDR